MQYVHKDTKKKTYYSFIFYFFYFFNLSFTFQLQFMTINFYLSIIFFNFVAQITTKKKRVCLFIIMSVVKR